MTTPNSQKQLWLILAIVFIGFVGVAIPYPIFPPLFLHQHPNSIIPMDWSDSYRSIWLGITLAIYPLGQFIGAPVIGALSDRYGRKTLLCLTLLITMFGYLISAISIQYHSLSLLVVSRLITGLAEGNIAIARAMAADLSDIPKHKSFGMITAVSSTAYVVGPLFGGILADPGIVSWFTPSLPFYLAGLLALITLLLTLRYIKETATHERDRSTPLSLRSEFNFKKRLTKLFQNQLLKKFLIASTIFTLAVDTYYEFAPVYLAGFWSMNSASIALYGSILAFALAITGAWLVSLLAFIPAKRIITTAILIFSLSLTSLVLVVHSWNLYWIYIISGIGISLATTNFTIHISNAAHTKIQGEAMGTMLSFRMLGDALICLIGGFLIISSIAIPIILSVIVALCALVYYRHIPQ